MMSALVAMSTTLPAIFPLPARFEPKPGLFTGTPLVRFEGKIGPTDKSRLRDCLGTFMETQQGRSRTTLTFRLDPGIHGEEAYRLAVAPHSIEAAASNARGLYWSLQTLRQLQTPKGIPCATIEDAPKFAWRGVLLDEGRHFMGPAFVKLFIDTISLYKFNVLHWHLTEDQGWRIEVKSHPELTRLAAWRKEADGSTYGGFYTQAQIKEIVAYAARRNVAIVPEIEMPGHSSAAITAYPELGCTKAQIQVPATWGVFQDVYCAGRESTFEFIGSVFDEVLPLFPSRYVHIGGDEVPKQHWHACPDCQARINAEGLKDEHELQSYFIRRIQKVLGEHGKTLVGWDEIMQGGLAPGAVVQVWQNQAYAKQAVDAGNPVILSPSSNCYLNRNPDQLPLEQVYAYNPMDGISDPGRVIGMETTLWSEGITTKNCLLKFLPRGLAMADIFWSNPPKDFPAFHDRLVRHYAFMDRNGVDRGPEDRALASFSVQPDVEHRSCELKLQFGMPDSQVRYSVGGSAPALATSNVVWPVGKGLTLELLHRGKPIESPVSFSTISHFAYGKPVTLLTRPSARYGRAGAAGLTDGLMGTTDFHDGIWLGWDGVDLVASIDLGAPAEIHEIGLHCLQAMRSWILMPSVVRFEVSSDGSNWKPLGEAKTRVKDTQESQVTEWQRVRVPARARYIRVTAQNYGMLPTWHNGAGSKAFIFADELVVR